MKILKVITLICFFTTTITQYQKLEGMQKIIPEASACAKICAGTIGIACLYGVAHGQVAARICPEYFTTGCHNVSAMKDGLLKKALSSKSPTILGLSWGIMSTWRIGALMSIPVIIAARLNSAPQLNWHQLAKPAATLLAFIGASSAIAGIVGYKKACTQTGPLNTSGELNIPFFPIHQTDALATDIPADKTNFFIANACAHNAAQSSIVLADLGVASWAIYKSLTKQQ